MSLLVFHFYENIEELVEVGLHDIELIQRVKTCHLRIPDVEGVSVVGVNELLSDTLFDCWIR